MNYSSFKEFVDKCELKDEATCKVKKKEIPDELNIPAGIYTRDDAFTTDSGIVNSLSTKGIHWVMFGNDFYFDSYGCPPPVNVVNQIERYFSEYHFQKNYSHFASYCLYLLYHTTFRF